MSIILCTSSCIVLFAYFLSMLITAILLSRSCPIVDLKNVLMRRRALKDLSAEHEVAGIVVRMEATLYRTGKCHGDHFDAWPLPSRLRFVSGMGPRSCSFQRLPSHLIAFHYLRHRNLIQFGCCLPERYISFARIILLFFRQGGAADPPPQPPRPVRL